MAVSRTLRFQILRRDNHTCRYCGRSAPEVKLTIDHVVPEALGGSDAPENLVTACADCNGGKSASPPDAAVVAQVSEDAVRWARARAAAANSMLAQLKDRQERHGQFMASWQRWKAGGQPLPLPSGWEQDVDRFLSYGLPMPLLLESIDIAMNGKNVKHDAIYKYMCGVIWNKIRAIDEAAAKEVAGGSADSQNGDNQTVLQFVQDYLADDEADGGLEELIDLDLEADEDVDHADVLRRFIDNLVCERNELAHSVNLVVERLAPAVRAELLDHYHTSYDLYEFSWNTMQALGKLDYLRYWHAVEYLKSLGDEEFAQWMLVAETVTTTPYNSEDRNKTLAIRAAAIADEFKASRNAPSGLCFGLIDRDMLCHHAPTYLVTFDPCGCGDDCPGHLIWCDQHMAEAVDGSFRRSDGTAWPIADFEEHRAEELTPNDDPWAGAA